MRKTAAVIVLLAAAGPVMPAAPAWAQSPLTGGLWPACEVTGRGDAGNTSPETLQMRLRRGNACAVAGRNPSQRAFVVTPPRNGTIAVAGGRATYRPNAGFAGVDVFVLSGTPPGAPNPIYTTVNVEVR